MLFFSQSLNLLILLKWKCKYLETWILSSVFFGELLKVKLDAGTPLLWSCKSESGRLWKWKWKLVKSLMPHWAFESVVFRTWRPQWACLSRRPRLSLRSGWRRQSWTGAGPGRDWEPEHKLFTIDNKYLDIDKYVCCDDDMGKGTCAYTSRKDL